MRSDVSVTRPISETRMPSSAASTAPRWGVRNAPGSGEHVEAPRAVGEQDREPQLESVAARQGRDVLRPLGQRRRLGRLHVAQREGEARGVHLGGGLVHQRRDAEDREREALELRDAHLLGSRIAFEEDRSVRGDDRRRRRVADLVLDQAEGRRRDDLSAVAREARRRPADLVGRDVEAEGERARRLHVVDGDVRAAPAGRNALALRALLPEPVAGQVRGAAPPPRTACGLSRARPGATRRSRPRGCARASGTRAGETAGARRPRTRGSSGASSGSRARTESFSFTRASSRCARCAKARCVSARERA